MNRLAFLGLEFGSPARFAERSSSVEPYDQPLSREDVLHHLRRVTFGPTRALAEQLVGKSVEQAVDLLLGDPQ